jgi:LuxR family maltose regulon positive regulatory protein
MHSSRTQKRQVRPSIAVTNQILATKLYIPPLRSNLVSRSRLLDLLFQGSSRKLTLISAPAGYGKTTLLSEWISQSTYLTCWLSLDARDNDLKRFLKYFIIALQQVENDLGKEVLSTLQSSQPLETEVLLTHLVAEIDAVSQPFIFVLDDYHVITESDIQQILIFLLNHQPRQMHLIISSRADPPWPLSRLRVRDDVLEIRSHDMRFTTEETAAFLNQFMGLALSPEDIAALEKRTEGWIAGLQMAAISMRGREDLAGFIQSFTGSHRFVMDYLMEEVLNQQSPEFRDFLLKTSILERLTGPLCDSVVGIQNSQSILLDLDQKNLFLISLDDQRQWYRYHQLFTDLLRNHLQQTQPDIVRDLHQKAGSWYDENGLFPDAVHHALAANDIERIVQLTDELAVYEMDYGELDAFMVWLDRLPERTVLEYPWLLVARSWAFFNTGNYEATETSLDEIERLLATQPFSDDLKIRIQGHVAAIRSYIAEVRDDMALGIQKAEDALALLPERDLKLRSFVAIRWANCIVGFGEFDKAIQAYKEAGEASKLIGDGHLAITALSEMATVQMFAGKLQQAIESIADIKFYAETLAQKDGRRLPAMGILYRHVSHIKRELNELLEAEYYANEAVKICQQWGEKETLLYGLAALNRVQFAQKKFDEVDQNFEKILQMAGQISPLTVTFFQNWKIHFQLMRGKTEEAEKWARDLGLTPDDEFDYASRFEYQNLAHLMVVKGNYNQALIITNALVKVATDVCDQVCTIPHKVLQALILDKLSKTDKAMLAMEEALALARAEGYVRSILDEGEAVGELLRKAIAQGVEVDYARMLLTALEEESKPSIPEQRPSARLVDPLSDRETEVLRLLVTDLTSPEIADELIVSVSTVRSHIKNIYSKLDVHSRHEAVTKARDLGIL